MDEPLAEFYYDQLRETNNPVGTLTSFYKSLFDIQQADESIYRMFARLYKIYGKELIYFALLDCADMDDLRLDSGMVRLISYFAKKRLENRVSFDVSPDLSGLVKEFEKDGEKKRKLKINKNPFDEEVVNE